MSNKTKTLFDEMLENCRPFIHVREDGKEEKRWVLNDAIVQLGYEDTKDNIKYVAKAHVSKENKKVLTVSCEGSKTLPSHTKARKTQRMNTVNIIGVIELINNSKMPKAKEFVEHINRVVIPSLIEHGLYVEGMENYEGKEQVEYVKEKVDEWSFVREASLIAHKEDAKYIIERFGEIVEFVDLQGKFHRQRTMAILEDELVNIPILGKRSKELKKEKGLTKYQSLRDFLTEEELFKIHERLVYLKAIAQMLDDFSTFMDFKLAVERLDKKHAN